MTTSQRYVSGAGTENRAAAAQNLLYELMQQPISKVHLTTLVHFGWVEDQRDMLCLRVSSGI